MSRVVVVGGSDAGISAALRVRELDPASEVDVVLADAYPNFSICGIPYYVSGDVARLAESRPPDGRRPRSNRNAVAPRQAGAEIDVDRRELHVNDIAGQEDTIGYDKLVIGTGAIICETAIDGLAGADALGIADGVHLLHSMGDTFAVMRTLEETARRRAR